MAVDSLRKRASIASLGLAFLGPGVIPDGSFDVGDRQAIGDSYYGIPSTVSGINVGGGDAQLEPYASDGTVTLEINVGGTAQLAPYTATGGVTLEINVGGEGQLGDYSSSGQVTIGDIIPVATESTGGWWFRYEQEMYRQDDERKEREKARQKALQLAEQKEKLDQELILELRQQEDERARREELKRLTSLAEQHRAEIQALGIEVAIESAIMDETYSSMERLERQLRQAREEELFLLQALEIILNA